MNILDILQGKWLGHPLHPAIVHVPLGGWIAACAIDVSISAHWSHGGPRWLALYCVVVGLIAAVAAIPPGIADWRGIKKGKPAWKLGMVHMLLNVVATVVWVLNAILRVQVAEPVTPSILVTSIAGTLLVVAGGYVGSLLVFDHGVSVVRQSKKTWRDRAVRGGARVPEES